MKGYIPVGLALVLIAGQAAAAATPWKCTLTSGKPTSDVVVDVKRKVLTFGPQSYKIQGITSTYITAIRVQEDRIGGEIWVINRKTGEFTTVLLSMGWDSLDAVKANEPANLASSKFSGKCQIPDA